MMKFEKSLYSTDTVKKALYKFADSGGFEITTDDQFIYITVFASKAMDADLQDLENQIRNEILDQDLRQIVAAETKDIRNLILANAFNNTELLN